MKFTKMAKTKQNASTLKDRKPYHEPGQIRRGGC